ncbi:MAG: cupredoxin domain-containing protein [Rubrobacteraceae bacterium]
MAGIAFCLLVSVFLAFAAADAARGDSGGKVVRMTGEGFEPERVELEAGEAVVFENEDDEGHWPASDDHPMHDEYPNFDPKEPVGAGDEWSFTFEKPGEWGFHDHMNPMFTGEVIVREKDGFLARLGGFFASVISAIPHGEHLLSGGEDEEKASHHEGAGDRYADMVGDEDPRVAMNQLSEDMEEDEELLRSCHPVVHEIGHAAYDKYGDFGEAMKYQDEVCNSGYVHGVIEERFAQSDNVLADMKTMCADYRSGGYLEWQCYHGIGHGVMYYTSNDLPRALEMCDAFEDASGRSSCYNGLFMENFGADGNLHVSEYVNEDDPLSPCVEQKVRHKTDCYLYAPTYYLSQNEGDYEGALKLCEDAEAAFRSACVQGVGSQVMKENLDDPKFVESVCEDGGPANTVPCVQGMSSLHINHHGELDPAREMCGRLESSNEEACLSAVRAMSPMFEA